MRLGIGDYREYMVKINVTGIVPQEFDKDKLTCFSSDQLVTWDEVHRKVQPGTDDEGSLPVTNNDSIMKFPRDQNGKLDIDNGAYSKVEVTKMNCKYTDEIRLSLGVAVVTRRGSSVVEGRRCKPFIYSSKMLISIRDLEKYRNMEIQRLKALKSPKG